TKFIGFSGGCSSLRRALWIALALPGLLGTPAGQNLRQRIRRSGRAEARNAQKILHRGKQRIVVVEGRNPVRSETRRGGDQRHEIVAAVALVPDDEKDTVLAPRGCRDDPRDHPVKPAGGFGARAIVAVVTEPRGDPYEARGVAGEVRAERAEWPGVCRTLASVV